MKFLLTRTVVSLRSSSGCLSLLADPPIKVIISVLGNPAGLFPLLFIHVETTSAWQAKDVIYEKDRKVEEKSETPGLNVVFLLHKEMDSVPRNLFPISTHNSVSRLTHQHSLPYCHTAGGTQCTGHCDRQSL